MTTISHCSSWAAAVALVQVPGPVQVVALPDAFRTSRIRMAPAHNIHNSADTVETVEMARTVDMGGTEGTADTEAKALRCYTRARSNPMTAPVRILRAVV
jgi:hypothetical protein